MPPKAPPLCTLEEFIELAKKKDCEYKERPGNRTLQNPKNPDVIAVLPNFPIDKPLAPSLCRHYIRVLKITIEGFEEDGED